MKVNYPSKSFGICSRTALQKGEPLEILIQRGWRRRLIEKSVNAWPVGERVDSDFANRAGWNWLVCNLFFPTLFVIHWAAIRAGYKMTHESFENELVVSYVRVA